MYYKMLLIAAIFSFLPSILGFECDQHATVCETSLNILYRLPMMTEGQGPVYPHNGKVYHYNDPDPSLATPVDVDEVITADGHEDSFRLLLTVNDTLPGPPIIVYEGQNLIIHVNNLLHSDAITIHYHGLDQEGTPWMDGAPFITQCPILPGQSFTYRFKVNNPGTFWYHSHVGHQRLNGLFGPFIIREKTNKPLPEHIMTIFEWNHDYGSNVDDQLEEANGVYRNRIRLQNSEQLDRIKFTVYNTHSGLINGRGRFWNNSTSHNDAPLESFEVVAGERYLFRVIGTGALYPWRVSVDQHNMTIVGTDGMKTEPVEAESFIITPGERYDFILDANQPPDNYWIRAETLDRLFMKKAEAILHYKGTARRDPVSNKACCTADDKCMVVNCPFPFYPENENVHCARITELRSALHIPTPHVVNGKFKEYFLNFAFPGINHPGPASINGRQFTSPTVSALTQPGEITNQCNDQICGEGKLCQCFNSLTINEGETIQLVFVNAGLGRHDDHPVHIHGHSFMVLKVGYGVYNETSGQLIKDNDDIDCRGSMCNDATWRNSSWHGGNVPDIVEKGAVLKDTVIVPSGGYIVTRFPASNPGVWFLHCHLDLHSNDGMAMVINETFSRHPKAPAAFPECRNFY